MNVIAIADLLQDRMIIQIGHEMHGTVEVHVFVVISLCVFCEFIYAAHGHTTVDQVRPFEK